MKNVYIGIGNQRVKSCEPPIRVHGYSSMNRTLIIGLCGLVFVALFSFSALADQSIGYKQYFNEGVKAFKEHDDQEALRCFKIAQIYDPSDKELKNYINTLEQRSITLEVNKSTLPPEDSIGYKYYLKAGIEALQNHDKIKAIHDFNLALTFYPDSKDADRYLEELGQVIAQTRVLPTLQPQVQPVQPQQAEVKPQVAEQPPEQQSSQQAAAVFQPPVQPPVQPPQSQTVSAPQLPAAASKGTILVSVPKQKMPPLEISLAQITNNGQANPKLRIELNSSVILDGKNIQRFLVVEEGYIGVRIMDPDRIKIDALKIGTTFIHIWDDGGRHTFYVENIFPKAADEVVSSAAANGIQHSQPFKIMYSNDYDIYYSGKNATQLKRQSYDFQQSLAITGETPYGFFDTSGSYVDYNSFSEFDTYTIGLSQIPLEGTSNFNLRGFDATRSLSPLAMPGTTLRGAFADVDLMDDKIGLSVSHGQEKSPAGFVPMAGQQGLYNGAYIDAVKLTLFPKSVSDQYSFNFATAYGSGQQSYLASHNYSVEGQHKFNDHLSLNAEEGFDSSHDATLASLRWQQGSFRSGLNFRNVDKNYSTVSSLPDYQGETGADWTTEGDFKNLHESTFLEVYRDHLNANPDNPTGLNYDANGHLRWDVTRDFWSDSDFNFVDTPEDFSPQRNFQLNERLSRSFGIWNSLKGTVYGGAGYQNSHSINSNISDFSREDLTGGVRLPLTSHVSSFANYEYDWLSQPHSSGDSTPSVFNTGLEYQKEITSKVTFNSQISFHDEFGVKSEGNSFYSGEESVIVTSGLSYNPTPDVNFFLDANASKVLYHTGNPSFDDVEVHVGMRIAFGGATYWDPLGTVSGIVFKDKVGDGKFVAGDEGVEGVKVKVGDKVAVTDKNGRYSIQVRAKKVDVVPLSDTVPGGLLFSTPQSVNVSILQGRTVRVNFGLISQTGIYGIVFVDKNGTRVPSEGDKFIGKVNIILDGKIIEKSDSTGSYYFRNVPPGKHTVTIDVNSIALNMVPLVKVKNQIEVAEGTNYMLNIPMKISKAQGDQD